MSPYEPGLKPRPTHAMPFQAHIDLLRSFLASRHDIVEHIQGVLNAQRKPTEYLRDPSLLTSDFEDCFSPVAGAHDSSLKDQLEEAHWAEGFKPRPIPGLYNGLLDPVEMMIRAFHLWQQTRWPGRNGRVRYAHTLFNLHLLRHLTLLSMRVWDDGIPSAGDRLSEIQSVLDQLWTTGSGEQPVLVRDARWLIPLAQSPATDDLGAYFTAGERVAESLTEADRIAIHAAGVRMAAGHLRSQTRYNSLKHGVPLDDQSLLVLSRTTNALDFALLIQELVPLLDAYERSVERGFTSVGRGFSPARLELADAICQGVSPDPELFLNRVDLLGAYSMIEHLFVTTDGEGVATYTPMGQRHVGLLKEYEARIGRVAKPLLEDCQAFRPVQGAYSPYGVLYGFSSNLIDHMVLKASQPEAVTRFGLEDVFAAGTLNDGKLEWVNGWRRLPHLTRDVETRFDYPQQFAEDMFNRVEQALRQRAAADDTNARGTTGRLFVYAAGSPQGDSTPPVPDLPIRYIGSSDQALVAAQQAEFCDEPRLWSDRQEGRSVLTYRTPQGTVGISKALLTEVLGAGQDAKIDRLPPAAAAALRLMCADLLAPPERAPA